MAFKTYGPPYLTHVSCVNKKEGKYSVYNEHGLRLAILWYTPGADQPWRIMAYHDSYKLTESAYCLTYALVLIQRYFTAIQVAHKLKTGA